MANAPVQVILNADGYRRKRITPKPTGQGTDFYNGETGAFSAHKSKLLKQVEAIRDYLLTNSKSDKEFVKVTMRPDALAKSHRPIKVVFRDDKAPEVGVEALGEMICALNANALDWVSSAIEKAEVDVRKKLNNSTMREEDAPTRYRCEVSAIARIERWREEDRRKFDIPSAVSWLKDPRSGHVYLVELFEHIASDGKVIETPLLASLLKHIKKLPHGTLIIASGSKKSQIRMLEVKLTKSKKPPRIAFRHKIKLEELESEFNDSVDDHKKLLKQLESHPLVRRIHLPNYIEKSPSAATHTSKIHTPKKRHRSEKYPIVGIIDGGISDIYKDWIISNNGILSKTHRHEDHGTFIAGLVVSGKHLNPGIDIDPDGCLLLDIDIFPDTTNPENFKLYYPSGMSDFFDEIEESVRSAVENYNVRIFNMSLNAISPALLQSYSLEAQRLDKIADEYDVIFVISAGNTGTSNMRPEWPKDKTQAASILASHRNDQLFIPAESIRNISVAALNPSGHSISIAEMPARYSRRGPGLRTGVKPDLSHVGGSGTLCPKVGHGLNSILPSGQIVTGCGTSYAAPLAAKMLASLDASIEGPVSRETLSALAIHNAKVDNILKGKEFNGSAQQLVGFGKPSTASDSINHENHEITMLFVSRMTKGQALEFKFAWPPSLVTPEGKCQGDVRLTLVSSPPINHAYGEEFVRVNIEAALQQEQEDLKFKGELEPTYVFFSKEEKVTEAELIEHKFKWSPIKAFKTSMPKGRGKSSNWRLMVNYLTRAGEELPDEGVPFSVLISISDPSQSKPIFQEMRSSLQSAGARLADIQTATRIQPRA